jgi:hypothetical protein
MRPIQTDLFTRNQFDIANSIRATCDVNSRIKDFRSVKEIIKISDLLVDAKKVILLW